MKELLIDLGFGQEARILVPETASFAEIKNLCKEQTGEELFCIKYSSPVIEVKFNEF